MDPPRLPVPGKGTSKDVRAFLACWNDPNQETVLVPCRYQDRTRVRSRITNYLPPGSYRSRANASGVLFEKVTP